jgi:hypothetical protein
VSAGYYLWYRLRYRYNWSIPIPILIPKVSKTALVAKECSGDEPGWKVEVQNNDHNHGPMAAASALPHHRIAALKPEERTMVRDMSALGHSPTQILNAIRKDNPKSNLIPRNIYNLLAGLRVEELAGKTPIEWLRQVSPLSTLCSYP